MTLRKRERHGMSRTSTYHAWAMMKQRCYSDRQTRSDRYKGRGIQVCERWRNSFIAFLADMGECPEGMSIDRIDNDGDYCPENCRWATPKEQANNTSRTRRIVIDGQSRSAKEVAEERGITYSALMGRLRNGWTVEQALELEPHPPTKGLTVNGETLTLSEWARRAGLSRQALLQRMQTGWTPEEAVTTPKGAPRPSRSDRRAPAAIAETMSSSPADNRPPQSKPRKSYNRTKRRRYRLGALVTELRQRRNWSQAQLAEEIGGTLARVCAIETGKSIPTLKMGLALARVLDVAVDDLVALLP